MPSSTDSPKKYWAFISYSSKDGKWGRWLHKRLENFVIPPEFRGTELPDGRILEKNIRPIFRDRDELSGSADLAPALRDALEESTILIVLCSPNSARSPWVNQEIVEFKKIAGEGQILALILSGEPNSLDPTKECFPPALRHPMEPLAGDLRKEGDGKERGFLKIVSGLTGIEFAKLFRRHERARKKRLAIAAAATTSIIIALSTLTIYAFAKKRQAVKAREASDDLVAFMVDDLYEQLRRTGRLNALGSAVGKIQEHQQNNPTSPENKLRTGLNQVSILFETGHPEEASSLATDLIVSAGSDASLQPSVGQLRLSLADYLAWTSDGLPEALDHAEQAITYFRNSSAETSPESLIRALGYRGDALRDLSRLDESAAAYREAISEMETRGTLASHTGVRSYDRLGEVQEMQGKTEAAQESYRAAFRLSEEGEKRSPEDLEWRCDKALALSKIDLVEGSGRNPVAEAEKLLSQLLRIEFSNARWRLELAKIKGRLSESDDGDLTPEQRSKLANESIELLESLTSDNPQQPVWQRELVNALNRRGHALSDPKSHREAMEVALANSQDPIMLELALASIIFQMWHQETPADQEKLAAKFDQTWDALPASHRDRPQCGNLRFQSLVERLRLTSESDQATEIRKQCEAIIESLAANGTSPQLIEHLKAQLANPE